jgi:hypothetical protein
LFIHLTALKPQTIYTKEVQITDGKIINKVTTPDTKEALITLTIDNKESWKYYNNNEWKNAETEADGMSAEELENLSMEEWKKLIPYTNIQFRYVLTSKDG